MKRIPDIIRFSALIIVATFSIQAADLPDSITTRLELARVLTYEKKYDEAAAIFRQILEKDPGNKDAQKGLGQTLFWSEKSSEALKVVQNIPAEQRDDETILMLADILVAERQFKEAEQTFQDYLDRNPDDAAARVRLADVLSWTKQYDKSLANFERVLQQHPNDHQVRRKYGTVLSWAGQFQKAAEQLKLSLDE